MKKSFVALLLALSALFTSACTFIELPVDQEQLTGINCCDDHEEEPITDPDPFAVVDESVYNPKDYSLGEGTPYFDSAMIHKIFVELNEIVNTKETIEINYNSFIEKFASRNKMTYKIESGKMLFPATDKDGRLVYLMLMSAIIEQYPDCVTDYDYAYTDLYNRENFYLLFVCFDYKEKGYENVLDFLKEADVRKTEIGNNSYVMGYRYMRFSRTGGTTDYCKKVFEVLEYKT